MSVVLDDALSQYLYIAEALLSGSASGSAYTIVGFYKSDSLTVSQSIYSQGNSGDDTEYLTLALAGSIAGDYVTHNIRDTESGQNQFIDSAIAYSTATWQHAAAVRTSSTSKQVYLNGGNSGTGGAVETLVTGARTAIGCLYRQSITWYMSGKIAEVAIWDVALTTSELAQLAAGATPTTIRSANLKGYWPLLENANDLSGNGKNLSASGSPTYDGSDHPTVGAGVSAPVDKTFSKKYVAAGNNEFWYESSADTMSELAAANGTIDTNKPLIMFEAFEKVFVVNDTNLKVADFGNIKIVTNNVGSDPPDFKTILTGGTSGAKMVVDYITALSSACTIYGKRITAATFSASETVTGTDDDNNAISFAMTAANEVAPPHWYDWTVYGNSTTYGAMPEQATAGCLWRGRITLTADKDYPHQWYQARQRNPWDWNYLDNDAQSPVAGGNADAGEVGDIVVAVIPYNRDYLIYGCASSLWVLAGDAAEGGSLYEFESKAGILGAQAWCWDKNENLYLLTTAGILKIPKGFGPGENLTEQSYPDFIKDLAYDVSLHRITMGYDRDNHGIEISKTTLADGTNSCWWYDLKVDGLFPDTYPEECGMFSMFHYEAVDPDYRKLLFGCNDGYIRFADPTAVDDDIGATDEAIDSYITFGPLKLGGEGREGKLTSILGVPTGGLTGGSEADSNDLAYRMWTGQTGDIVTEKLIANTNPTISGTITATQNIRGQKKRRKIRGMFAGIRVGNNTAAETWGLERLLVNVKESGRL